MNFNFAGMKISDETFYTQSLGSAQHEIPVADALNAATNKIMFGEYHLCPAVPRKSGQDCSIAKVR